MTASPPDDAPRRRDRSRRTSPRTSRGRLLTLVDRVPTGWFATILTAGFLAVTAAFGGLAAVASPPLPELPAGAEHRNEQFALTVDRAVLIDELPGSGVSVADGQRVLALVVTAENVWDRALPSGGTAGVIGAVRVAELGDVQAASVARLDDATISPYLQPGVPAELVLTWAVDRTALAGGDVLHIDLRDLTLQTGKLVTYGESWIDPVTAAHVSVEIRDVGAGAEAESEGANG